MKTDAFLTTRWTAVLSAKGSDTEARRALSDLCQGYYAPVVAYVCRDGESQDAARDLAHGFFEWLLEKDRFASLEPRRARFRSYLLGALKHYLSHQREWAGRLKRGGQVDHLALEDVREPEERLSLQPDREFDRQWALHVIRVALDQLKGEWNHPVVSFGELRPFLAAEAAHGDLSELAELHGMKESTVRGLVHRLKKLMRHGIRDQVAETLPSRDLLDDEMEALFAALAEG